MGVLRGSVIEGKPPSTECFILGQESQRKSALRNRTHNLKRTCCSRWKLVKGM